MLVPRVADTNHWLGRRQLRDVFDVWISAPDDPQLHLEKIEHLGVLIDIRSRNPKLPAVVGRNSIRGSWTARPTSPAVARSGTLPLADRRTAIDRIKIRRLGG